MAFGYVCSAFDKVFISFLGFTAEALKLPSFAHLSDIFVRHLQPVFQRANLNPSVPQTVAIAALGLGVLTDVLTASVTTWYVLKLKEGSRRNDTIANKLIVLAVRRHTQLC